MHGFQSQPMYHNFGSQLQPIYEDMAYQPTPIYQTYAPQPRPIYPRYEVQSEPRYQNYRRDRGYQGSNFQERGQTPNSWSYGYNNFPKRQQYSQDYRRKQNDDRQQYYPDRRQQYNNGGNIQNRGRYDENQIRYTHRQPQRGSNNWGRFDRQENNQRWQYDNDRGTYRNYQTFGQENQRQRANDFRRNDRSPQHLISQELSFDYNRPHVQQTLNVHKKCTRCPSYVPSHSLQACPLKNHYNTEKH